MAQLRDEKVSLSVSSLRAYGLDEELLGDLAAGGITGLTFSPEAGTQRMRDVVSKNVTEDDILESAHRVFSRGHQRMKLYFMIGLPTETDEDVLGIVETAARVQEIGRRYLRGARVAAAVSTFVPKPHTPFAWAAMDSREEIARKQALLAEHARRLRVDLRLHENLPSHLEGIFARGDRACADLLERAFRLGCRFDGWSEVLRPDLWEQAIAEEAVAHGFDPARYLGAIPEDARLPWDHLDVGVERDFLRKEWHQALRHRASPPCGKPAGQLLHPASVAEAEAAADRQARVLRLRRRLRSRRDEARAALPSAPDERVDAASAATEPPARRQGCGPGASRAPTGDRHRRRPRPRAIACATASSVRRLSSRTSIWCATCRAPSAAPASRSTTPRAFTPSRACRSAPRWGWGFRLWGNGWT